MLFGRTRMCSRSEMLQERDAAGVGCFRSGMCRSGMLQKWDAAGVGCSRSGMLQEWDAAGDIPLQVG